MGDHCSLTKTQAFVRFLTDFAAVKYHMKINLNKIITTDQRQHIQTLSYECNFDRPKRPINKLIAQLCYPEHGYADKYMFARVVSITYASCGIDYTFYLFCRDVYNLFLPFAAPLTTEAIEKMKKYLPGIFKLQDEVPTYLQILKFPTLQEILLLLLYFARNN